MVGVSVLQGYISLHCVLITGGNYMLCRVALIVTEHLMLGFSLSFVFLICILWFSFFGSLLSAVFV